MFAVVEIGTRQYKVAKNDQIEVEKLEGEAGKTFKFDKVLLISENDKDAKIGQPYISGASVEAKLVNQFLGDKIRVFKFIPKKRHQKTQGHRQNYTCIQITAIKA